MPPVLACTGPTWALILLLLFGTWDVPFLLNLCHSRVMYYRCLLLLPLLKFKCTRKVAMRHKVGLGTGLPSGGSGSGTYKAKLHRSCCSLISLNAH